MNLLRVTTGLVAAALALAGCTGSAAGNSGTSVKETPAGQESVRETPPADSSASQQPNQTPENQAPSDGGTPQNDQPARLSKQEVLTLVKKAYSAQELLRTESPIPVKKVRTTLEPWFSPEWIETFIKTAGQQDGNNWIDHADSLMGHIIDYSAPYVKDVRLSWSKDNKKVWISGVIYWEGQSRVEVTTTVQHTDKGWKISEINYK
ncbi:DUF3993 domain-containing protein [Staphylospora marina]|uniref:DUF3993 domain-containing protein n=1 Tax=Staphylospora marina TaxID=2490858 RepID=UPI0013DE271E|nr:DUF3993 domain-containing protein [Staphylospora marina]